MSRRRPSSLGLFWVSREMGKGVFDVTLVFGTLSSYAIWVNGQAGKAMSVTFSFVFCIFLGGGGLY